MKKLLIIPALLALIATSCTERIDLDLNSQENQRVVVDGWFTNIPKEQEIKLTLTTDYFENEKAPPATGATVRVTDGLTTWDFTEAAPGIYRSAPNVKGEFGTTYTLEIEYEGETFTSSALLDTVPQIDTIISEIYVDEFTNEIDEDWRTLYLFTQELEGKGDYYMWRVYKNGDLLTDTLREVNFVEDELVDGNYIAYWAFDYVEAQKDDVIKVEQIKISKEAFAGFNAVMLETDWRGGIFDSPPANVGTNIEGGALGFFIAAGVDEFEFTLPE